MRDPCIYYCTPYCSVLLLTHFFFFLTLWPRGRSIFVSKSTMGSLISVFGFIICDCSLQPKIPKTCRNQGVVINTIWRTSGALSSTHIFLRTTVSFRFPFFLQEDERRVLIRNKRLAEALGIRAALGAGAAIGGAKARIKRVTAYRSLFTGEKCHTTSLDRFSRPFISIAIMRRAKLPNGRGRSLESSRGDVFIEAADSCLPLTPLRFSAFSDKYM